MTSWLIHICILLFLSLVGEHNLGENTAHTQKCMRKHYGHIRTEGFIYLYRIAHIMIAKLVKLTFYTSFQLVRYHDWFKGLRWLESKWQAQHIACCLKVYRYRSTIYICNSLNTIQRIEPTIRWRILPKPLRFILSTNVDLL